VKTVTGFAGFTMTDPIGKNDIIFRGIQQLPRPEKPPSERPSQKGPAMTARAMQNKDGIRDTALFVFYRYSQSGIMEL